jgi:hypothetical protein
MRRSLIAAALGLGLLAAGGVASVASAGALVHPAPDGIGSAGPVAATPVHYQRYGYHGPHRFAAPPHHHWRHAPAPWHRGYRGQGPRHGHPQAWHPRDRYRESLRRDWRG